MIRYWRCASGRKAFLKTVENQGRVSLQMHCRAIVHKDERGNFYDYCCTRWPLREDDAEALKTYQAWIPADEQSFMACLTEVVEFMINVRTHLDKPG